MFPIMGLRGVKRTSPFIPFVNCGMNWPQRYRRLSLDAAMTNVEEIAETPAQESKPLPKMGKMSRKIQLVKDLRTKHGFESVTRAELSLHKCSYIADRATARFVAEYLKEDIKKGRCIMEANPGLGYLSRQLIAHGCQQLHLFCQRNSIFMQPLKMLAQQYPDRIRVIPENILMIKSLGVFDLHHGSQRELSCLKDLPVQERWEDAPKITLFSVLNKITENGFLRSLVYMAVPRVDLFSIGRIDLVLIVSSRAYNTIRGQYTETKGLLKPYNVLFDLAFEVRHLTTIDRNEVIALQNSTDKNKQLHLIRLTARVEQEEIISSSERFEEFAFFLTQGLLHASTVAQSLDMWIPHAYRNVFLELRDPASPLQGIKFYQRLGELKPYQIVELFRIFRSHELFEHSSFKAALEKQNLTKQLRNMKVPHV